jgi:hypothetical protein
MLHLLRLVADFEKRLLELLNKAEQEEAPDEHQKINNAVGHVVVALGDYLLYPIYRRHKELIRKN